jgi:membrane protease YdiL (CAAX protease family)
MNKASSNNPALLLLVILLATIAVTCVVGPILKIALDAAVYCNINAEEKGSFADSARSFAWEHLDYKKKTNMYDFAKVARRIAEITFVIMLLAFARKLGIPRLFAAGFATEGNWKGFLLWGFLLGCFSLGLYCAFLAWKGIFYSSLLVESFGSLITTLAVALVAAAIISVIEEILFRATLLQIMSEKVHLIAAILISSLIYSLLHFCKSDFYTGAGIDILIVPRVLASFFNPLFNDPLGLAPGAPFLGIIPEALGLFLAGIVLGTSYVKSGSLYLPIGIHAGWVFVTKIEDCFFLRISAVDRWLYGGDHQVTGLHSWIFLVRVLLLVVFGTGEKKTPA